MPQLVPSGARSRNETAAESANKKKPRASEGSARRGAGGRASAGGENISAPDKRTCDGRIVPPGRPVRAPPPDQPEMAHRLLVVTGLFSNEDESYLPRCRPTTDLSP